MLINDVNKVAFFAGMCYDGSKKFSHCMAFSLKHIGLAFLASLGAGLFVYSVFHIGMYQPEHIHTGTLQEDTKIFVM